LTETVEKTATGAILYDKSVINRISEDRFSAQGWPHSEVLTGQLRSGGRGNTMFVGNVPRQFVLRHYVRGGMVGKLVNDSYVYSGEDATRSFREWRMLAKMVDSGLRVPRPAAARYVRRGTTYTADIITVRIPNVVPLSQYIAQPRDDEFWFALGNAIHEFHRVGVFHADMNAYNLQIDNRSRLWMLDFDKGRLRQPGTWQQKTLDRLHRSLHKVKDLDSRLHYTSLNWNMLLEGYFNASRSA